MEDGLTLWIGTNPHLRKVRAVAADPQVTSPFWIGGAEALR